MNEKKIVNNPTNGENVSPAGTNNSTGSNGNVNKARTFGNKNSGSFNNRNSGRNINTMFKPRPTDDLSTTVLSRRTVSKTRTGGRQRGFSVLVAVGNRKGKLGIGSARSVHCNEAIQKAEQRAKKNVFRIPLLNNRTIQHNVTAKVCSTRVLVHKARQGTGIVAGGCLWNVFDLLGVKDIVCKTIGASNSNHNMVYSLVEALKKIETLPQIAARRNKTTVELMNKRSQFLG